MEILKKEIDIYNYYACGVADYDIKIIKEIINKLEYIEKIINNDFNHLSDDEFLNLILNFYDINISKEDFLAAISKTFGKKYGKIQKINTKIFYKGLVSEGHGRDFSWWEETYQIKYYVATPNDLIIVPNHNYSKEELNKLGTNKQIIHLISEEVAINPDLAIDVEDENGITIPNINCNTDFISSIISYSALFDNDFRIENDDINEKLFKNIVAIIRKRLPKDKVLKTCKEYIDLLNNNNILNQFIDLYVDCDEKEAKEEIKYSIDNIKNRQKKLGLN